MTGERGLSPSQRPCVVTGCGVFGAAGTDCGALFDRLKTSNVDHLAVREDPLTPAAWVGGFLPEPDPVACAITHFGESVGQAVRKTCRPAPPAAKAGLVAALEAWSQAGLAIGGDGPAAGSRVAVIVAGQNSANEILLPAAQDLAASGRLSNGRLMQVGHDSYLVSLISEVLGARAEGAVVGGAQASGHMAQLHGARLLASGEADAVLVVGAPSRLTPLEIAGYQAMGALAADIEDALAFGCRSFDARACGFVPVEMAAAMLLETEEHADRRSVPVRARLTGWASAMHGTTLPRPDAEAAGHVMQRALIGAGLVRDDITAVSAHATGTPLGDRVEAEALAYVFDQGVWINTAKSILGHGLNAAGVLESVCSVLQMGDGFLHGCRALKEPVVEGLRYVPQGGVRQRVDRILNTGFGFGGFNAAVVLEHPDLGEPV